MFMVLLCSNDRSDQLCVTRVFVWFSNTNREVALADIIGAVQSLAR